MPSSATTRNRLEKQAAGENANTWGTKFNTAGGSDLLDSALDGVEAYSLSGSKTLTTNNYVADEARMRVQNITGGTGGTVTIPAVQKVMLARAGSSGPVTFSNGTNSVAVAAGNVEWFFTNGTDIYRVRTLDYGSDLLSTTGTPTDAAHLTTKTYVDAQIAAAVFDGFGSLGAGVGDFLTTPSSANLRAAMTDETGTGALVFANSPTLVTPALGTPASGTLTNCTGLPVGSVTGLGANVATFLASPTSANLAAAVTGETGSGALVFAVSPDLTGTPTAPTAATATNTTQIATTAFVKAQLASTALTGTPTAPTAALGTNTTQIATTEFVTAAVAAVSYVVSSADYTLTSTTSRQRLFNETAAGAVTLATGLYEIEIGLTITGMVAGSGSSAAVQVLGAGTATIAASGGSNRLIYIGGDSVAGGTTAAQIVSVDEPNTSAKPATGDQTSLSVLVSGVIRVTGAGTVIPSITLDSAAAAVVERGSYFVARRLGADTAYTAGTWS